MVHDNKSTQRRRKKDITEKMETKTDGKLNDFNVMIMLCIVLVRLLFYVEAKQIGLKLNAFTKNQTNHHFFFYSNKISILRKISICVYQLKFGNLSILNEHVQKKTKQKRRHFDPTTNGNVQFNLEIITYRDFVFILLFYTDVNTPKQLTQFLNTTQREEEKKKNI